MNKRPNFTMIGGGIDVPIPQYEKLLKELQKDFPQLYHIREFTLRDPGNRTVFQEYRKGELGLRIVSIKDIDFSPINGRHYEDGLKLWKDILGCYYKTIRAKGEELKYTKPQFVNLLERNELSADEIRAFVRQLPEW